MILGKVYELLSQRGKKGNKALEVSILGTKAKLNYTSTNYRALKSSANRKSGK